jgi:hypothetical protein
MPRVRVGGAWRYPELDCHHWWNVYYVWTESYRHGRRQPVHRLSLREAREELMRWHLEEFPEEYVLVPLRVANLACELAVDGGNPLEPLSEKEWPDQVMITRRLYAAVMDRAEGKPPKRRRRKKATKGARASH